MQPPSPPADPATLDADWDGVRVTVRLGFAGNQRFLRPVGLAIQVGAVASVIPLTGDWRFAVPSFVLLLMTFAVAPGGRLLELDATSVRVRAAGWLGRWGSQWASLGDIARIERAGAAMRLLEADGDLLLDLGPVPDRDHAPLAALILQAAAQARRRDGVPPEQLLALREAAQAGGSETVDVRTDGERTTLHVQRWPGSPDALSPAITRSLWWTLAPALVANVVLAAIVAPLAILALMAGLPPWLLAPAVLLALTPPTAVPVWYGYRLIHRRSIRVDPEAVSLHAHALLDRLPWPFGVPALVVRCRDVAALERDAHAVRLRDESGQVLLRLGGLPPAVLDDLERHLGRRLATRDDAESASLPEAPRAPTRTPARTVE